MSAVCEYCLHTLRFVSGCRYLTHDCQLYTEPGWPSLSARRYTHWLIYKALLGLVSSHMRMLLQRIESLYALCSRDIMHMHVLCVRDNTEKRKIATKHSALLPLLRAFQIDLNLPELITLPAFWSMLNETRTIWTIVSVTHYVCAPSKICIHITSSCNPPLQSTIYHGVLQTYRPGHPFKTYLELNRFSNWLNKG